MPDVEARLKEQEASFQAEQTSRTTGSGSGTPGEELRQKAAEEAARRADVEARLKEEEARLQREQEARASMEAEAQRLAEEFRQKAMEESRRRAEAEARVKEQRKPVFRAGAGRARQRLEAEADVVEKARLEGGGSVEAAAAQKPKQD